MSGSRCRSCNAEITWGETSNGKRAPFDPDGTNHFATCPQRRDWRKQEPKLSQPSLMDSEQMGRQS